MAKLITRPSKFEKIHNPFDPSQLHSGEAAIMQATGTDDLPLVLHDKHGKAWRRVGDNHHPTLYCSTDGKNIYREYVELIGSETEAKAYSAEADAAGIAQIHAACWPLADQTAEWVRAPFVNLHLQRAIAQTNSICFLINQEACAMDLNVGVQFPASRGLAKFIKSMAAWFGVYGSADQPVRRIADSACIIVNRDGTNIRAIVHILETEPFEHLQAAYNLLERYRGQSSEAFLLAMPDGEVTSLGVFRAFVQASTAVRVSLSHVSKKVKVEKASYGMKVLVPFRVGPKVDLDKEVPEVKSYETLSGQSVIIQYLSGSGVHLHDAEAGPMVDIALALREDLVSLAPTLEFKAVAKIRYEGVVTVTNARQSGKFRMVLDVTLMAPTPVSELAIRKVVLAYQSLDYDLIVQLHDEAGVRTLGGNMLASRRRMKL